MQWTVGTRPRCPTSHHPPTNPGPVRRHMHYKLSADCRCPSDDNRAPPTSLPGNRTVRSVGGRRVGSPGANCAVAAETTSLCRLSHFCQPSFRVSQLVREVVCRRQWSAAHALPHGDSVNTVCAVCAVYAVCTQRSPVGAARCTIRSPSPVNWESL